MVKSHAGSELLPALEAVLQGRQFVGSGLSGQHFTPQSDSKIPDHPNEPLSSPASERREITPGHGIEFYPDDAGFVAGFTCFIEAALESRNAVIVVASDAHRNSLVQRLRERGVDIVAAFEQGRYVSVDVVETLSTFMENDRPDPPRFRIVVDNLIVAVLGGSP